jgi:NurA-like 5'-3' nuclease
MKKHTRTEVWEIHVKLQNEYQAKINELAYEVKSLKHKLKIKERSIVAQETVLREYMEEVNTLRPLLKSYVVRRNKSLKSINV